MKKSIAKGHELTYEQKWSELREWWPVDGSSLDDATTWGRVVGWEVIGSEGIAFFKSHQNAFSEMCSRLCTDPAAKIRPKFALSRLR